MKQWESDPLDLKFRMKLAMMQFRIMGVCILLFFAVASGAPAQEIHSSTLSGPYLGQKPPGMTPEIFAPGIVSTEDSEGNYGFMDDGKLFLFTRLAKGENWKTLPIWITEERDGSWTEPVKETLGGLYPYNFTIDPGGGALWFTSLWMKDGSGPLRYANIWWVERVEGIWSEPVMLEPPVNTDGPDAYPAVTRDGTLYFVSVRPGGFGQDDIYRAESIRGGYPIVENLGLPVNTEYSEVDVFVSPDESCLIFCSDRPGGYGKFDLYVSFRGTDGLWSEPVNMGKDINTPGYEFRPSVTQDGKYFFFTRWMEETGEDALYWVSAGILDALKLKR